MLAGYQTQTRIAILCKLVFVLEIIIVLHSKVN